MVERGGARQGSRTAPAGPAQDRAGSVVAASPRNNIGAAQASLLLAVGSG
eukprot:COSAG03_NODE_418_length_8068_cov_1035.656168_4_plen_50_part_00